MPGSDLGSRPWTLPSPTNLEHLIISNPVGLIINEMRWHFQGANSINWIQLPNWQKVSEIACCKWRKMRDMMATPWVELPFLRCLFLGSQLEMHQPTMGTKYKGGTPCVIVRIFRGMLTLISILNSYFPKASTVILWKTRQNTETKHLFGILS